MANRVWAHFRPASEPLTPRITRQCSKKKRDRKSTRLNSSHLVISYAVSLFRKSTRLNSSHLVISYAVFCLKKKIIQYFPIYHRGPPIPVLSLAADPSTQLAPNESGCSAHT